MRRRCSLESPQFCDIGQLAIPVTAKRAGSCACALKDVHVVFSLPSFCPNGEISSISRTGMLFPAASVSTRGRKRSASASGARE